ncbi:MAG: hypothetical protein AABY15_08145, partial [Nanoarchaeota archaeon]
YFDRQIENSSTLYELNISFDDISAAAPPPAADTTPPTITLTVNVTLANADTNDMINFTFNGTDTADSGTANITNGTIARNLSNGIYEFFNFSFRDTSKGSMRAQNMSINFTFPTAGVYNVTGIMRDNSSNAGHNITIFNVATISADTCTYSSGDWNINCADNCVITSPVSMPNNDIHTYGTGTLEIKALIDVRNVFNRCNLFCYNTPSCFG